MKCCANLSYFIQTYTSRLYLQHDTVLPLIYTQTRAHHHGTRDVDSPAAGLDAVLHS